MKSTRLHGSIMFGTGLCLDWRKARVIRSFRVEKSLLPPTLHSSLLHNLLQTLPFPRFINSIKPLLGSPVIMGRSVWVAVVTDNLYHTFIEKKRICSVKRRKVPCMKVPHERKCNTVKVDQFWAVTGIHLINTGSVFRWIHSFLFYCICQCKSFVVH